MKKYLEWKVSRVSSLNDTPKEWIDAKVPGAAQLDYAKAHNFKDYKFSDNFHQFDGLEDSFWVYKAIVPKNEKGKKTIFFCGGIDYEYEIYLNAERIYYYEGMFTPIKLDITSFTEKGAGELFIKVYPTPKRKGAKVGRWEADNSAKPPVSYEWDWHPRLISQGIWKETYLEIVDDNYIKNVEISYELTDDLKKANVKIEIETEKKEEIQIEVTDGNEKNVCLNKFSSSTFSLEILNPLLWWPHNYGKQNLYIITLKLKNGYSVIRKIGLRRAKLVTQECNWWIDKFPFTQATPPITLEINNIEIFAKGSNWVNPEIFVGTITKQTYEPLIKLARESNMNIFRCWGGAIVNKEEFFTLCDEYGIMVWQEFPLACNSYRDEPRYLAVLEKEATSIVKSLRTHPCVVLWCGGNELFTGGAGMTEQFLALRLLNSVCLNNDKHTPFINTSPIMGMRHGHYLFRFSNGEECFKAFQSTPATAFTEFGCPAPSDYDYLKTFIPEDELNLDNMGKSWIAHHGLRAWEESSWLSRPVIESYFGVSKNLKQLIERGQILSRNGYKGMFEEARRQKPNCHMAINWCYNEPWPTAANNSLINYPAVPRDSLKHIAVSLKDTVFSARVAKFSFKEGEVFSAEMFVLNDKLKKFKDIDLKAYIQFNGEKILILDYIFDEVVENKNAIGAVAKKVLPYYKNSGLMKLILSSEKFPELNNSYEFLYYNNETVERMTKNKMTMDFVGISENIGDFTEIEI